MVQIQPTPQTPHVGSVSQPAPQPPHMGAAKTTGLTPLPTTNFIDPNEEAVNILGQSYSIGDVFPDIYGHETLTTSLGGAAPGGSQVNPLFESGTPLPFTESFWGNLQNVFPGIETNEEFNPLVMQYLQELLLQQYGEQGYNFERDPWTALLGPLAGLTGPELGQNFYDQALGNLQGGPAGNLLQPDIRDVNAPGVDLGTLQSVMDMFSGLGQQAAGYINPPDPRSISMISDELRSNAPFWNAPGGVLDWAGGLNQQIGADVDAGYGLLGIPSGQIQMLQEAAMGQAGAAEQSMQRMLDDRFNLSGQLGQGAQMDALLNQAYPALADMRAEAVTEPWYRAYEMGPALGGLMSNIGQADMAFPQMGLQGNLADLQRQLEGQIAQANVFSGLAGQGGAVGGNIAMADAQNELTGMLANQEMDYNTWAGLLNTLAPSAFAAPYAGLTAGADLMNMTNAIPLGLMEQAIQGWFTDRGVQAQEDAADAGGGAGGLIGGGLSALGSIVGAIYGGPAGAALGGGAGSALGGGGAVGGAVMGGMSGRAAPMTASQAPNIGFSPSSYSPAAFDLSALSSAPMAGMDPWAPDIPDYMRTGVSQPELEMGEFARILQQAMNAGAGAGGGLY